MARYGRVGAAAALIMAVAVAVKPAAAVDDFWQTAARGLQFAGWAPPTGDIGVSRHVFGDGWTVQTRRTLDNWTLNGGVVGFELSPGIDPVTGSRQSVSLDTEASFRRWAIPTVNLRIATDRPGTNNPVPVEYNIFVRTGAQDVELKGQGILEAEVMVNALGFYDIDAMISNRGSFSIVGVLYADQGSLDYDLGPISLSGNVFVDLLAAVTQPLFGATDTANPLAV